MKQRSFCTTSFVLILEFKDARCCSSNKNGIIGIGRILNNIPSVLFDQAHVTEDMRVDHLESVLRQKKVVTDSDSGSWTYRVRRL